MNCFEVTELLLKAPLTAFSYLGDTDMKRGRDRQKDNQKDRQTNGSTDRCTHKTGNRQQIYSEVYRRSSGHTHRQIERQRDLQKTDI